MDGMVRVMMGMWWAAVDGDGLMDTIYWMVVLKGGRDRTMTIKYKCAMHSMVGASVEVWWTMVGGGGGGHSLDGGSQRQV